VTERAQGLDRSPQPGVGVVALRGDEVLLVRRRRAPAAGCWRFPGGLIEWGESSREAAAREVHEETGLRLRIRDVVDVFDVLPLSPGDRAGVHYVVVDFLAEPEDPAAEPVAGDDAEEARWVPLGDLEGYAPSEAMLRILGRALAMRARRARLIDPRLAGLYVITAANLRPGRTHQAVAEAAVRGGATVVQLREKEASTRELVALARDLRAITRAAGALFLVNDRVDVALAADADGVHLGVDDLPVREARRLLGPERLIGYSPETLAQLLTAEAEGADYLGVGDVFGTTSKPDAGAALGLDGLRRRVAATTLPVIAIGGITRERVAAVRATGAAGFAVIGAVAGAAAMESAVRELVAAWQRAAAEE